jgi:hypothetical protein
VKDDLTTLLEAVRLVRAEVEGLDIQRTANATRSLARIAAIMNEPVVRDAIQRLDPGHEAPSIAPSLPGTRVH